MKEKNEDDKHLTLEEMWDKITEVISKDDIIDLEVVCSAYGIGAFTYQKDDDE